RRVGVRPLPITAAIGDGVSLEEESDTRIAGSREPYPPRKWKPRTEPYGTGRLEKHPPLHCTTSTSTREACVAVRYIRSVCALKSDFLARKMFGTNVCGFRS